jgi:hypothetical protein
MRGILTHARLVLDLLSMKLFVELFGRGGELLDSHLFFFDRYSDLADYHSARGRTAKAERLAAIAEAHYQAAPGDDDPPEAAAMAMPVLRPVNTSAVSTVRVPVPDDGQPSDLVPQNRSAAISPRHRTAGIAVTFVER